MHCELVVPALLAAREMPRMPSLELLFARGRVLHEDLAAVEEWLRQAFHLDAPELPAGALTVLGEGGAPGTDFWVRADPVHLRVERDGLALVPGGAAFGVTRAEAEALAAALNEHFGERIAFFPMHPERWCARLARAEALGAPPPLEIAGQSVARHLPQAGWCALLNEIQMALHAHPANQAREIEVNSLWLWGAGPLPAGARGPWHSVSADDPVAAGLAQLAGMRRRALPAGAREWLERAPGEGRHLVLLDGLRAVHSTGNAHLHGRLVEEIDRNWFEPLLEALRSGRIGMVTVRVPDAGLACETIRGDLRRFWRRVRPLAAPA